jgi:hypothetical protein
MTAVAHPPYPLDTLSVTILPDGCCWWLAAVCLRVCKGLAASQAHKLNNVVKLQDHKSRVRLMLSQKHATRRSARALHGYWPHASRCSRDMHTLSKLVGLGTASIHGADSGKGSLQAFFIMHERLSAGSNGGVRAWLSRMSRLA